MGLEPRLLRSQLGSNLWRTLGTTAALTVGLGLFVAMQIWGYSMLEPFKPGDWVPDMLVAFQRGGLPDAEIAAVRAIEGVRADQCIPLAVEQPKLASDITGSENTIVGDPPEQRHHDRPRSASGLRRLRSAGEGAFRRRHARPTPSPS